MSALILAAKRSAVCPSGGAFRDLSIEEIAAPVVQAVIAEAGLDPADVGELILGNALGAGGNPARRVALASGLPSSAAGLTVDRQCVSGLDAIGLAASLVASSAARIIVAGGVESHSNRPVRSDRRSGIPYEQAPFTPWADRDPDVAVAAAALASRLGISREEADAYAIESHSRALSAADTLKGEIVPIAGVDQDTFTRRLTNKTAARARVISGTVTAANMAVSADAAGFCVVAAPEFAGHAKAPFRILAKATVGAKPEEPALAALPAISQALSGAGLAANTLAAVDLMEAFSVQAIATIEAAGFDPARVNRHGGALARGHPIGASGAIGAVRVVAEARKLNGPVLAAIPAAGGLGSAMIFAPA